MLHIRQTDSTLLDNTDMLDILLMLINHYKYLVQIDTCINHNKILIMAR